MFNEVLNIKSECIKSQESGYHSTFNRTIVSNSSSIRNTVTHPSSNAENRSLSESNASIGSMRNENDDRYTSRSRNVKRQNVPKNNTWIDANNVNSSNNDQRLIRNEQKTWGNIDDDAIIMCNCHENAIRLTVKKEGPNHGTGTFRDIKDFSLNMTYYNVVL